ncbi:MAG TPA: hypothetical protein VKS81_08690 [Bacteroidota bacterium]|nr:hypothetical protein [Bacteroidota bacterium]
MNSMNANRMRAAAIGLIFMLAAGGFGAGHHRNIIQFYPVADSTAKSQDFSKPLVIVRQKQLEGWYVTFVAPKKSKKVTIVAVTKEPISNADSAISRRVKFKGVQPTIGGISAWGYIFDRNGDGKIDYMELLSGAAPVESDDMPEVFPTREQPVNPAQVEIFVAHCRLIFDHWADDNFDGKLDAVIVNDMDPYRDWVNRMVVIRSTHFNGHFNDVWGFQNSITDERDTVAHALDRIPYIPLNENRSEINAESFKNKSGILDLINRAAVLSGLKPGSFVTGEEEPDDETDTTATGK